MNHERHLGVQRIIALVLLALPATLWGQAPLGSEFSYKGQLKLGGVPLNDTADLEFALFDALEGGSQIGETWAVDAVDVVNGLFTVELDFGAVAFDGNALWLEVAVRAPAGSGDFITLIPRQPLTATPYALQTRGLFVDEAGNIGVGSSSPDTALVTSTSEDFGGITIQTEDNALSQGLRFVNSGGSYTWSIMREDAGGADADLVFSGGPFKPTPQSFPNECALLIMARWASERWIPK
ncbi:MAG: hypothetical protein JSU63_18720 [Phycisphaerales bacterium]|nr:MAG: hypothetical protein JSU63_18720 [Phycisphaerales bacterium]